MIFKPEMVEKILAGEKTVTRRPVKFSFSDSIAGGVAKIRIEEPCRYKKGRIYRAQPGRGQRAVASLRILHVSQITLGILDDAEARLEGFESGEEFELYWQLLYGECDPTQLVHRIEFELVAPTQQSEVLEGQG